MAFQYQLPDVTKADAIDRFKLVKFLLMGSIFIEVSKKNYQTLDDYFYSDIVCGISGITKGISSLRTGSATFIAVVINPGSKARMRDNSSVDLIYLRKFICQITT